MEAVLWTLGAVVALACLVFVAIFVRFVAKATASYLRKRPYPALAVFAIPGGLGSFIAAFLGTRPFVAVLIGLAVGLASLMLVAVELGSD